MAREAECKALKDLFECEEVTAEEWSDGRVEYTCSNGRWHGGVTLTYARMMQLPAILGTEKLDFETPYQSYGWTEDTGDLGGHTDLTIVARY